ncbi:MAG: polyribonucleotide nucleotidyltransferase [Patescibacteria group bacterium]
MNKKVSVSLEFAGKTLTLETGHLAPQATAAIVARLGDTVVLATVVEGKLRPDMDYFPLSVEYGERLYAGGKIKGSRWVKREGRPSDEAVLSGRLIDRSIRPLFPKEYKKEVQVIVTVLSVDAENDADILALNAVSAALSMSRIPWKGPIGAIRMGLVKNEEGKYDYLFNPTITDQETSELDIVVSQTKEKTHMIEAGALQVSEAHMAEAVAFAHEETSKMIASIEELVSKVGQPKSEVIPNAAMAAMVALIDKGYQKEILELAKERAQKETSGDGTDKLVDMIFDQEKAKDASAEFDKKIILQALETVMFKIIRRNVVEKQQRMDGRKLDEIRELGIETGVLPRTHGSALFQRGLTQALTIATLGSPRLEQVIESAEGEEIKRFIHHYSGLPYSFGQTGRVMGASRREIGHGALAERALKAVIPSQKEFPYTIRLVSEVLSQNGSSSMASTCGSTLALMDAGVPITKPVAGISVGMMSDGDKYELLTDIIGIEDFSGDMDFKVAGTETGITAIQLDVKILGLTDQQVVEILARARSARMQILEKMLAIIPQPRTSVSEYAPKIELIQVPVDKIGEVIGPGGKNIRLIIAQTGAQVDVEDDGTVAVSGLSEDAVKKAVDWISGMTRDVVPGEVFEGPVKKLLPFGAFIEYLPGREGMVHVSKMRHGFVNDPSEVVSVGDIVKVRVEEKDQQGRINLSMLFGDAPEQPQGEGGSAPQGGQGGGYRSDRPQRSFGGGNRSGGGSSRFSRDNNRGPRNFSSDRQQPAEAGNEHPLARQLRRESREERDAKFPPRKRFSR